MTSPTASLVIVSYNGWEELQRCLESVFQDDAPPAEVIVVDNASSDGSPLRIRQHFPQVILIEAPENLGFAAGCNLGAAHARGNYLAFLNPDTIVARGWLRALLDALENDPSAGLATSKILLLDQPNRLNTCGNQIHLTGITLCRGINHPAHSFDRLEPVNAVSGAAFMIRSDLFHRLGGFDEDLFLYMEDADLSLRARLAGYRCLYAPGSQVYHDYRLSFGPRKTFYQERNRYAMLLKAFRWRTLFLLAPALLLAEAITWGFTLLYEPARLGNKLEAYRWLWRNRRRLLDRRRSAQKLRRVPDRPLLLRSTAWLDFRQAVDGLLPRLAEAIFNPLFGLHKLLLGVVVWW